MSWATRALSLVDIICLRQIYLCDRWRQSLLNFFDLCNVLMNFLSCIWNKWAEGRHFWPKLQVTGSCIRRNVKQVLHVFKRFFTEIYDVRMVYGVRVCICNFDNKSKSFSFVFVCQCIFHASNCISQTLIFPVHLSFFSMRITHPHCLYDRQPHSI